MEASTSADKAREGVSAHRSFAAPRQNVCNRGKPGGFPVYGQHSISDEARAARGCSAEAGRNWRIGSTTMRQLAVLGAPHEVQQS